jgi:hypothetical protein
MLYIIFWNYLYTRTKEEHFLVIATISILKHYSLDDYSYDVNSKIFGKVRTFINRAKSAMFHLYFLLSSYQCQNSKCLLLVFCFAVINPCVYFVRRGLHISWYNFLSNPIVYVQ